ncbi:MAG TPA: MFS transporter [Candidatus Binataceae bacterium]|nr:MFS transporter [Candidatus Binataceae bacterium]
MSTADASSTRWSPLWRNPDFLKLWSGSTISQFGSLVIAVALPFAAILALGASPFQMALLRTSEIIPALIMALIAGVWVDRLKRRPILIVTDLGRAILLATIPAAAFAHLLTMAQLYAVTLLAAVLGIFFDVAYRSYLPSIVAKEELAEANSKLGASASVAEVGAFSLAGWMVQVLSAPIAILIDAISFLFSAAFVWTISAAEPSPHTEAARESLGRELTEGARFVLNDPILRALVPAIAIGTFGNSMFGTEYSLYALRALGFKPALLGVIFAIGGIGSLVGALIVGRISNRFGAGPTMIAGLVLWGLGELCVPIARHANTVGAALMIAQQLSDGAGMLYYINLTTLRQTIPPGSMLGRVNATMRFLVLACQLAGTLASGILAEIIGLRATLALGASANLLAAGWLAASPIRNLADVNLSSSYAAHAP